LTDSPWCRPGSRNDGSQAIRPALSSSCAWNVMTPLSVPKSSVATVTGTRTAPPEPILPIRPVFTLSTPAFFSAMR
jgi:hypothetical protein